MTKYLFLSLSVISCILLFVCKNETIDINLHDHYFIIDFSFYFIWIIILSSLTFLIYFLLEKFGRPINVRIGFWHFVLIFLGLLFLLPLYRLVTIILSINGPDAVALGNDTIYLVILLIGPICLLTGLIIFVIGIIKAIFRTQNT